MMSTILCPRPCEARLCRQKIMAMSWHDCILQA